MRHIWIPRLIERIQAASRSPTDQSTTYSSYKDNHNDIPPSSEAVQMNDPMIEWMMPEPSRTSSESLETQVSLVSGVTKYQNQPSTQNGYGLYSEEESSRWVEMETLAEESLESLWNQENVWFLQQQLI